MIYTAATKDGEGIFFMLLRTMFQNASCNAIKKMKCKMWRAVKWKFHECISIVLHTVCIS